jgi:hypothetical protein
MLVINFIQMDIALKKDYSTSLINSLVIVIERALSQHIFMLIREMRLENKTKVSKKIK